MTGSKAAAATAMHNYFVDKIDLLVKRARPNGDEQRVNLPNPPKWPPRSAPFSFSFTNAGKVSKVIKGLGSTTALGVDGIPVSVLKLGVEVLAGPIGHVVNRSLAEGKVPNEWKTGIVKPVFKGAGKNRSDCSSYRPVCILTALSKVLELTVKTDLNAHLAKTNAIPTTQHGFRTKRSCSTALGSAHAGWLSGLKRGKLVGLLGFDLSAAFDTLDPEVLLDKLMALGIRGRSAHWFRSYLTDGKQCVDWDGEISGFVAVKYGVRQGSILGPVLFLVHTAYMASAVGTDCNVTYADDSNVWAVADSLEELREKLEGLAARFTVWAKTNGLVMNAGKTQMLVGGKRTSDPFTVNVGGKDIKAGNCFELLGVRFDNKFSTLPHDAMVAAAARQQASLVARLSHHVPRGNFLRQLATGLVLGKISHALPTVAMPRLTARQTATTKLCRLL
jgi:hypothetical protein